MLYVIRHGQVPSNVEGIISGWNDEKLTPKGIKQAFWMREEFQNIKFDEVYSSPIPRAEETARLVAPKNEIILDDRLAERDPGSMLGKPRKSIDKIAWNSLDKDRAPDGAETLAAGLKRVTSFLDEIDDAGKNVLVVTHAFISKCIWVLKNGVFDMDAINSFSHENGEIKQYEKKLDFSEKRSII